MDKIDERIIWIDVETNGLDQNTHKLLQVAAIITDGDYNIISESFEKKIFFSEEDVSDLFAQATPYVQKMHTDTGLWASMPIEGEKLDVVDSDLHNFLMEYVPEKNSARLGGNSITLDRNFLNEFLPKSFNHISYQSYDMTSIDGFFRAHYGDLVPEKPELSVGQSHDALADIIASIDQAKMLRDFILNLTK